MSDWGVNFYSDTLLLAVLNKFQRSVADVKKNLIYLYPWLRAVDDHHIKIVKSHIRKSLVNACFGIFIGFMLYF